MGIYGIYCHELNKWYVGESTDIHSRFYYHLLHVKRGNHHHMQGCKKEYTVSTHILELVEDKQLLLERECYWMLKKDSLENGFNLQWPNKQLIERMKQEMASV